ncbi:FAD:protein FMN transferase [Sporolactobacillus caesalpiniae]|uniref:FAD:protein FMN transferase n=1 Tax=Sporolactobacillus caesalpiniae TaxID=3230362 RepID=UPI0040471939
MSLLIATGCSNKAQTKKVELLSNPYSRTEFLMGTVVTVKIYDKGKAHVLKPVFKRIEELAHATTVEDKNDRSEIDEVNDQAGIKPVKVSKDIYRMVKIGKKYSRRSHGSFDLTIGPLTKLWHIGFSDARKPAQSEIDHVLPLIGYKRMILNDQKQTIFLKDKGMRLDLGAIAKGFITDEAVTVLKNYHVQSAIVDLGGNIFVMGNNASGEKWTVGIQNPYSPRGEIVGEIKESNQSIVTSGIYERFIKVHGKIYHHLLNPAGGYPFTNDIAGVSVITDASTDGDALSTVLFAEGVKGGLAYAKKWGIKAVFVTRDKKVYVTPNLKNKFVLTDKTFSLVK